MNTIKQRKIRIRHMDRVYCMKVEDFKQWFNEQLAMEANAVKHQQFVYVMPEAAKVLKTLPGAFSKNYEIWFKEMSVESAILEVEELFAPTVLK